MSTCTIHGRDVNEGSCPVVELSQYIGDFWNLWIIRTLLQGPQRFSELLHAIPKINKMTLVSKLTALKKAGFIDKKFDNEGKSSYTLTKRGQQLQPIIDSVALVAKALEN